MAKAKKVQQGQNEFHAGIYIFAAIFIAVGTLLFMFILYNAVSRTSKAYDNTMDTIEHVNNISTELQSTNIKLLMLIAGTQADPTNNKKDIEKSFQNIEDNIKMYESIEKRSDAEIKRFNHARAFIDAYQNKASEMLQNFLSITADERKSTYVQEVYPLQITAIEMFDATTEITKRNAEKTIAGVKRAFMSAEAILLAVMIAGEIAVFVVARVTKRDIEAIAKQAAEIEAATAKFKHTKEKASEMAYTNILTGMKNRYALDNDISGRLETDQFNSAVFDMDNFRSINDMYGYDFGDEYLAMVAERLKEEYGNDAEIYNITGNEFCFVFNKEVSDIQATRIAERVIQTLAEWYTVLNLNVQLTASGSTCHYLPGDCISVSALLVKLDNVLRDAKRNGGNMVLQVVGI